MLSKSKGALVLMAIICLSSCATIFSGTKSKVSVLDGNPSRASVYVNGNFVGETPTSFKIPKKSFGKSSQIEIRAQGYKPVTVTIEKRIQAGYIILDLLTGVVELIVDFATGAIYTADPKKIQYKLEKL